MGEVKAKKATGSRVVKYSSIFNSGAWNDFVNGAGLERVRMDRYYLGKALPGNLTKRTQLGCEKLLTNLFADAILAGAVVLPGPYSYEDFVFRTVWAKSGSRLTTSSNRNSRGRASRVYRVDPKVDILISLKGMSPVGFGLYSRGRLPGRLLSSPVVSSVIECMARDANVALSYVPPGVVIEHPSGTRQWWVDGVLHRDGAPAIEGHDVHKWYQNGKCHREDGPAVEKCGTKEWRLRGQLHRADGPARERFDGWKEWFVSGKRHRDAAPAVMGPDGYESWYRSGKKHRGDGPAVVNADGTPEWWLDGTEVDEQTIAKASE